MLNKKVYKLLCILMIASMLLGTGGCASLVKIPPQETEQGNKEEKQEGIAIGHKPITENADNTESEDKAGAGENSGKTDETVKNETAQQKPEESADAGQQTADNKQSNEAAEPEKNQSTAGEEVLSDFVMQKIGVLEDVIDY